MISPLHAFVTVAGMICLASACAWSWALRRVVSGQSLLPYEPREEACWGLLDLLLAIGLWLMLPLGALLLAARLGGPADLLPAAGAGEGDAALPDAATLKLRLLLASAAMLAAGAVSAVVIVARTGARLGADLGFNGRQAARDLRAGAVAFLMLAPPVYAIQLVLVQWFPSEHPLVKVFQTNPTVEFFLLCVLSAAVVAPLVEEFLFRVLLQGWLERLATRDAPLEVALFGERRRTPPIDPPPPSDPPPLPDPPPPSDEDPGAGGEESAGEAGAALVEPPWATRVLPILGSSLLFALLHWTHGPDPVALFLLALGLGYLYQRTHRLLPCVVLHFLLNAFSLAALGLSLPAP